MTNELARAKDDAIHFSSQFDCSPAALWHAITDPQELSAWLGGHSVIEPRVGGSVLLHAPSQGMDATGVVRIFDPPRPEYDVALLEHTFVAGSPAVTSICRWVVRVTATGSELVFTQDGPTDDGPLATAWTRGLVQRRTRANVARGLLAEARTVLLISFIGHEVPMTLVNAGFNVLVRTGPEPDAWASCTLLGEVLRFEPCAAPAAIDLLHLDVGDAFDEYLEVAVHLGAKTFWYHSARTQPPAPHDNRGCWLPPVQSETQRAAAHAAGVAYVDDVCIADIARELIGKLR